MGFAEDGTKSLLVVIMIYSNLSYAVIYWWSTWIILRVCICCRRVTELIHVGSLVKTVLIFRFIRCSVYNFVPALQFSCRPIYFTFIWYSLESWTSRHCLAASSKTPFTQVMTLRVLSALQMRYLLGMVGWGWVPSRRFLQLGRRTLHGTHFLWSISVQGLCENS